MHKELPTDPVTIAVVDPATGAIRQIVQCLRRDADKQHHAFPGHVGHDISKDAVRTPHPDYHRICLESGRVLPRGSE